VKFPSILPKKCLFLAVGIFNIVESYDIGPLASLPSRRKVCYGFLLPSKICLLPGLNPRTMDPVASTKATRPPMAIAEWLVLLLHIPDVRV
jgi:hypothetical protein